MKRKSVGVIVFAGVFLSLVVALAMAAQDKYTLKVPGGLAFSEFKGYESWQVVSISQDGPLMAAILANPVMIKAYQAGIPANGRPSPMAPSWPRSIGSRKRWRPSLQRRCRAPSMTWTSC